MSIITRDGTLDVLVPAHAAARLGRGAKSILLGERASLDDVAGIPWYSIATIRGPDRQRRPSRVMTGPARYDTRAGWYLPNLGNLAPTVPLEKLHSLVRELRARDGFSGRDSRPAG